MPGGEAPPLRSQLGYPWLPLRLDYALTSWRVLKQAGRTPFVLSALRNAPVSFMPLPELDVVGSSPIARSLEIVDLGMVK